METCIIATTPTPCAAGAFACFRVRSIARELLHLTWSPGPFFGMLQPLSANGASQSPPAPRTREAELSTAPVTLSPANRRLDARLGRRRGQLLRLASRCMQVVVPQAVIRPSGCRLTSFWMRASQPGHASDVNCAIKHICSYALSAVWTTPRFSWIASSTQEFITSSWQRPRGQVAKDVRRRIIARCSQELWSLAGIRHLWLV